MPLSFHSSDWDLTNEHFAGPQPAWVTIPEFHNRGVPMAFKSVGVTAGTFWNLDAPIGTVGMHGQPQFAGITWTSPVSGIANLTGHVWKMRNNIGRTIDWRLTLNGSILTGGTLTEANPYTWRCLFPGEWERWTSGFNNSRSGRGCHRIGCWTLGARESIAILLAWNCQSLLFLSLTLLHSWESD